MYEEFRRNSLQTENKLHNILGILFLLTFEWRSRFPTCTGRLRVPLTTLFYWGESQFFKSGQKKTTGGTNTVNMATLTCIQDTATFPAHSSVVSMIPNQNTARTRKMSTFKVLLPLSDIWSSMCQVLFLNLLPEHVYSRGLLLEAVFVGRW